MAASALINASVLDSVRARTVCHTGMVIARRETTVHIDWPLAACCSEWISIYVEHGLEAANLQQEMFIKAMILDPGPGLVLEYGAPGYLTGRETVGP